MKIEVTIKKSIRYILLFCTLLFISPLYSQEDDHADKDSVSATSPDFMPVYYDFISPHIFKELKYDKAVDTSMVNSHRYDQLITFDKIYQSLGIMGQAHQPIVFDFERENGYSMYQIPYPLYCKKQKDLQIYKVQTSYTRLAYAYGFSTENGFMATHAQRFRGVTAVVNLNGYTNQGYYTHQKASHINADALFHYEIPSGYYGFRVSYILGNLKLQENGGIVDNEDFLQQVSGPKAGYNVNTSNSTTHINTQDLLFQQYVNIKDKKKKKYFGTVTHSFQYKRLKSVYFDSAVDSLYYKQFYNASDTTLDSLHCYNIINTLQWSNFSPFDTVSARNYFIRISGGITHEYTENKLARYYGSTLMPFGRMHLRLFSHMDIYAQVAYTFMDYNANDLQAKAGLSWAFDRKKNHLAGIDWSFYYFSPDYIYSHYWGGHNRWDYDWGKENVLKMGVFWNYKKYRVSFNYFMLHNYLVLDSTTTPMLIDKPVSLLQLNLYAPFRVKGFGFDVNASVQYSDNKYIPVPVFAGKAALFYVFRLFKSKMGLQIGLDMMYNTAYYGNSYYPLLHQFYYQEKFKTGNFFYVDAYLTINVKRINLFVKLSNFLSGVLGYNYFTTPNYPMQDRNFSLGINWRFYD